MGQSTTYYRISNETFIELETSGDKFDLSSAKSYVTLEKSFMGLEFVLSKNQEDAVVEQVKELFIPSQSIGGQNIDFEDLDAIAEFDFDDFPTPYLNAETIGNIHKALDKISTADIENSYDAEELNSNGIYPEIWHNDNSPNLAFNLRHLVEDFTELKSLIKQAADEGDYLLVYAG